MVSFKLLIQMWSNFSLCVIHVRAVSIKTMDTSPKKQNNKMEQFKSIDTMSIIVRKTDTLKAFDSARWVTTGALLKLSAKQN